MSNLNDLINLAKADGGKFFVIDEKGEPKLVIMGLEDYQKLLLGKIKREVEDIEEINRQIIKAQMQQDSAVTNSAKPKSSRAIPPSVDLREEVIDPSFDFEGPKVEIDDL